MTKPTIFIDGEAGTTGLEIRKRIEGRTDIEIVSIASDKRKDPAERKRLLNECSLSILCLPDDAAREAVSMVSNPKAKIIDASTAFRIAPDWAYGFPELTLSQEALIRSSTRVSNPGCYPTGALALIRPLTDAKIISPDERITINAVSGYSGGGKELIAICESKDKSIKGSAYCLYGLDQKHKHIPEMRVHGSLKSDPLFLPSYSGSFYRGMLINIALRNVDGEDAHEELQKRFSKRRFVSVEPIQTSLEKGYVLSPEEQNNTNNLQLRVFWNAEKKTTILTACLDNLGKGASGAAVQNMEIMLGL